MSQKIAADRTWAPAPSAKAVAGRGAEEYQGHAPAVPTPAQLEAPREENHNNNSNNIASTGPLPDVNGAANAEGAATVATPSAAAEKGAAAVEEVAEAAIPDGMEPFSVLETAVLSNAPAPEAAALAPKNTAPAPEDDAATDSESEPLTMLAAEQAAVAAEVASASQEMAEVQQEAGTLQIKEAMLEAEIKSAEEARAQRGEVESPLDAKARKELEAKQRAALEMERVTLEKKRLAAEASKAKADAKAAAARSKHEKKMAEQ